MGSCFRFKQFTVVNERSAQKVGTDGVLLGAWVSLTGGERRILDAGTGTGVIALMLAQRHPSALITGIDIDLPSVEEASLNFSSSPWSGRLSAGQADFREYAGSFDLVVSNPPFFVNSLKNPSQRRAVARHDETLSHDDLADGALRLMAPGGRLAVVLPYAEGRAFLDSAQTKGLHPVRVCEVRTLADAEPRRLLVEMARENPVGGPAGESLVIQACSSPSQSWDNFTEQYRALTRDFYLKF